MKLLLSLIPLAVMNTVSWVLLALLVLAVVLVVIYLIRAKKKEKTFAVAAAIAAVVLLPDFAISRNRMTNPPDMGSMKSKRPPSWDGLLLSVF